MECCEFQYDVNYDYSLHLSIVIGKTNNVYRHYDAQKFKNETLRMCYANGIVKLEVLNPPPKPLLSLFSGNLVDLKHFLKNILEYNSAFQIVFFGADKVIHEHIQIQYIQIYKIQG